MSQTLTFRPAPGRPIPRLMKFSSVPGRYADIDRDNEHRGLWRAKLQAVRLFGDRLLRELMGEDGTSAIPNIAKGRFNEWMIRVDGNDPANAVFTIDLLVDGHEALSVLEDYDDLAALLVPAANTICTFTNYARVVLDDTDVAGPTVDDTGDDQGFTFADITPAISAAGNGSNETIGGAVIGYDSDSTGGTNAGIIPMHLVDFTSTLLTNGSDLDYDFPAVDLLLAT